MTRLLQSAGLVAIGRVRTAWSRGDCPKNMVRAREAGKNATVEIDADYRAGLEGLSAFDHVVLIGWFGPVVRPVPLVQHPSHRDSPRGVFALRSPLRPNPIALSIARIEALDVGEGLIKLDALDWFDGTPLLDIKPYYASTDAVPEAVAG